MSNIEFDHSNLVDNLQSLRDNPYPGRGIVLGVGANGDSTMAYWIMGRSENSRNRRLVQCGQRIMTEAVDKTKVVDPSLIIYNAFDATAEGPDGSAHIVSNGDQTDSVINMISLGHKGSLGKAFREGLMRSTYQPDRPNYTTRITGMIAILGLTRTYNYSLIKRHPYTEEPEHTFGSGVLAELPAGSGLAFHTYKGDGNPLPAFEGSPYLIPLQANAEETAEALWDALDKDNRVAIAVKTINFSPDSKQRSGFHIINQLGDKL
jgi:IMP cyclohydrolase